MFFDNFTKLNNANLDRHLFWEYTINDESDWNNILKNKRLVVKRVIELGRIEDFYAIFNLYGGVENVKSIIKEIEFLNKKDMNFVSVIFKIKLEELRCYKKMLLIKKPILY